MDVAGGDMSEPFPEDINCPHCDAAYKVVLVETASDAKVTCRACCGWLASRTGKFAIKSFLIERPRERNRRGQ
jgi:hypothetical protein